MGIVIMGLVKPIPKPFAPPRLFEKLNPNPLLLGISAYAAETIRSGHKKEVFSRNCRESGDDIKLDAGS